MSLPLINLPIRSMAYQQETIEPISLQQLYKNFQLSQVQQKSERLFYPNYQGSKEDQSSLMQNSQLLQPMYDQQQQQSQVSPEVQQQSNINNQNKNKFKKIVFDPVPSPKTQQQKQFNQKQSVMHTKSSYNIGTILKSLSQHITISSAQQQNNRFDNYSQQFLQFSEKKLKKNGEVIKPQSILNNNTNPLLTGPPSDSSGPSNFSNCQQNAFNNQDVTNQPNLPYMIPYMHMNKQKAQTIMTQNSNNKNLNHHRNKSLPDALLSNLRKNSPMHDVPQYYLLLKDRIRKEQYQKEKKLKHYLQEKRIKEFSHKNEQLQGIKLSGPQDQSPLQNSYLIKKNEDYGNQAKSSDHPGELYNIRPGNKQKKFNADGGGKFYSEKCQTESDLPIYLYSPDQAEHMPCIHMKNQNASTHLSKGCFENLQAKQTNYYSLHNNDFSFQKPIKEPALLTKKKEFVFHISSFENFNKNKLKQGNQHGMGGNINKKDKKMKSQQIIKDQYDKNQQKLNKDQTTDSSDIEKQFQIYNKFSPRQGSIEQNIQLVTHISYNPDRIINFKLKGQNFQLQDNKQQIKKIHTEENSIGMDDYQQKNEEYSINIQSQRLSPDKYQIEKKQPQSKSGQKKKNYSKKQDMQIQTEANKSIDDYQQDNDDFQKSIGPWQDKDNISFDQLINKQFPVFQCN